MERRKFEYISDLVNIVINLLGEMDDNPIISIYGKYEVIKQVLEDLIMNGISIANEIELQDYNVAHYDKEYVLYLTESGINVEKEYGNKGYYYGGGTISFVHEDCNSKLLSYIDSKVIYEFGMTDLDGENDNREKHNCSCNDTNTSESIYISKSDDGTPEGFSKSWCTTDDDITCYSSYSHYSNNVNALRKVASEFGVVL